MPRKGNRDVARRDGRELRFVMEPLSALARLLARQAAREQLAPFPCNDGGVKDVVRDKMHRSNPENDQATSTDGAIPPIQES